MYQFIQRYGQGISKLDRRGNHHKLKASSAVATKIGAFSHTLILFLKDYKLQKKKNDYKQFLYRVIM